jgi:hypothetical protein
MASPFDLAGAAREPSPFAALHTTRIVTGLYTNRNAMRDAATTDAQEKAYGGRRDSIWDGLNCEISPRLTLRRRPGTSIYNANAFNRVNRFYSFNTFSLTDEVIHVLADCQEAVYEITNGQKTAIWIKPAGSNVKTYFLGVGNTLYFTNGLENKMWIYGRGVFNWGGPGPTTAPTATQAPRPNPYGGWTANTGHACWIDVTPQGAQTSTFYNCIVIKGKDGNLQQWGNPIAYAGLAPLDRQTGSGEPTWNPPGQNTMDGTAIWLNKGPGAWQSSFGYGIGEVVIGHITGYADQLFISTHQGRSNSSGNPPIWPTTIGQQINDGSDGLIWKNAGPIRVWSDFGVSQSPQTVTTRAVIVDSNGYLETVYQMGKSGADPPAWNRSLGYFNTDGPQLVWINSGPFFVGGTATVLYGYAWKNSVTQDLTDMSPKSAPILVQQGNQVTVQGDAPTDRQYDTVIVYSTLQGGAIFGEIAEIAAPAPGQKWTYIDTTPGSVQSVNLDLQAQVNGEGTPLPTGATALEYHLGRIFVAVGNVVYISSGPDAIASGSSGNAGFGTTFTCQSKITRFWVNSLGIAAFTVRDSYMILGSGTDADPLYMVKWIENLPLLSYDCLATHKTNAIIFTGQRMVLQLDPGAGIIEPSFPIADQVDDLDPASSYLTFHTERSGENALYLSDGEGEWFRMAPNSAPETGINWSTRAILNSALLRNLSGGPGTASCVQTVETTPGVFRLLFGPGDGGGRILFRDLNANTDAQQAFYAWTTFGSFALASPGQLAALAFISLDSAAVGTPTKLSVLLGEIEGEFEPLRRTRQEPPDLPPSKTLTSDRFHLMQNEHPIYCRHMQMRVDWPAEDAANELYGFSLYGQLLEEYR